MAAAASARRISADGRFVAFYSMATNLVPGDTNGTGDVFVRDRQTGTTERVSVGSGGVQGDGDSFAPGDLGGRTLRRLRVVATNLVPGDTNGTATCSSATARRARPERVSVGPGGAQGNGRQLRPGDLGGRAVRRLRLGRHQPGAGRHQQGGRRLCPYLSTVAA